MSFRKCHCIKPDNGWSDYPLVPFHSHNSALPKLIFSPLLSSAYLHFPRFSSICPLLSLASHLTHYHSMLCLYTLSYYCLQVSNFFPIVSLTQNIHILCKRWLDTCMLLPPFLHFNPCAFLFWK